MKKLISITTLLLSIILLTGMEAYGKNKKIKASNNYITKELYGIKNFNSIEVRSMPDVEYTQSKNGNTSVSVHCPDNILEYLDVSVNGNTLTVGFKKDIQIEGRCKVKVTASSPELKSVKTTSAGDIKLLSDITAKGDFQITTTSAGDIEARSIICNNINISTSSAGDVEVKNIKCDKAELRVSSAGDIDIDHIDAMTINASTSSAGDIELAGRAVDVYLSSSSAGDIDAGKLKAKNVTAKASSAGDITCYAENSITATASSMASEIVYSGPAADTNLSGKTKNIKKR